MNRMSPEEVLASATSDLPPGSYLTAALVVVTYVVPGEHDEDEQGPFLAWRADGVAGRWVHLGMAETAAADMRSDLTCDGD
jgi:hypothetical protein